jgi:hypothetical protein
MGAMVNSRINARLHHMVSFMVIMPDGFGSKYQNKILGPDIR